MLSGFFDQLMIELAAEIIILLLLAAISIGGWYFRRIKKKKRMDFIRQIDDLEQTANFESDEAIIEIENKIDIIRDKVITFYVNGQISREGLELLNEKINNKVNRLRFRYLKHLLSDSPKLRFTVGILSIDNQLSKNDIKTILNEIRKDTYLTEKQKVDHVYHIKNTFGDRNRIVDTREIFYSDAYVEDRHLWNNIKPFIYTGGAVFGAVLIMIMLAFTLDKGVISQRAFTRVDISYMESENYIHSNAKTLDIISNTNPLRMQVSFNSAYDYTPSSFEKLNYSLGLDRDFQLKAVYYLYESHNRSEPIDSLISARTIDISDSRTSMFSFSDSINFELILPDEGLFTGEYTVERITYSPVIPTSFADSISFCVKASRKTPKKYVVKNKDAHKVLSDLEAIENLPKNIEQRLRRIRAQLNQHEKEYGPNQTCVEMQIIINELISELNSLKEHGIDLPKLDASCKNRKTWQQNFVNESLHACLLALGNIDDIESREWVFHFRSFLETTLIVLKDNNNLRLDDSTLVLLNEVGQKHNNSGDNEVSRTKIQSIINEINKWSKK